MGFYLSKFRYTPEAWKGLLANPVDRVEAVRKVTEARGGRLVGYWFAFGEYDGYVISEMPDNVTVASVAVEVAASGTVQIETVVLLTPEEMAVALQRTQDPEEFWAQADELSVRYSPPWA